MQLPDFKRPLNLPALRWKKCALIWLFIKVTQEDKKRMQLFQVLIFFNIEEIFLNKHFHFL